MAANQVCLTSKDSFRRCRHNLGTFLSIWQTVALLFSRSLVQSYQKSLQPVSQIADILTQWGEPKPLILMDQVLAVLRAVLTETFLAFYHQTWGIREYSREFLGFPQNFFLPSLWATTVYSLSINLDSYLSLLYQEKWQQHVSHEVQPLGELLLPAVLVTAR